MTTTSTLYPTTVAATTGTTWANTTNATGSTTGTVATFTNATNGGSGGTGTIQLSGYAAQTAIGNSGAIVSSVAVTVNCYVATANRWSSITAQLYTGTTAIGTAQTVTISTSTTNSQTITFTGANAPSYAQCADLRVQVTAVHSGATSSVFDLDTAGLTVTYAVPAALAGLTDTFATKDTTKWAWGVNAANTSGQVVLTPTTAYDGFIQTPNTMSWALTGSSVYVQLAQATNVGNGGVETYFSVYTDNPNSNSALFDVIGGQLKFVYRVSGVTAGSNAATPITYDPVAHQWLRLRESGGTIFWDTSPDASTWTQQASWVAAWSTAAVGLAVGTGYAGTEPSPGTAIIDNVNVPPPVSAAGSITLGGSAAAAGNAGAAGSVTLGGAATAGAAASAVGSLTLSGTATGAAPSTAASASGALTLTGTATAVGGGGAAGAITLTGSGSAAARPTAAGTLTLGGSGSPQTTATATGAITLGGSGTARATGAASGTITLAGSGAASATATAAGGVTLSGTATGTQPGISAGGSLTLSGSAAATVGATASGGLSLGGSSAARATVGAVGGITVTGAATASAGASSSGGLTLAGAAQLSALANAAGQITLAGLATGADGGAARDITITVGPPTLRSLTAAASARTVSATVSGRQATATVTTRATAATAAARTLTGRLET